MIRELWRQLRYPNGLRVIHGLPKGLTQQEPQSLGISREVQRKWLSDHGISQVKAVRAVKP